MTRRIIKSDALDSYLAKSRYGRNLLQRHFLAFVRVPVRWRKATVAKGYLFYATDNQLAVYQAMLFDAFIIGSSLQAVRDANDVIQALHEETVRVTSDEDAHGSVILAELKGYIKEVIDDKDEPRPATAETIILNALGNLYWCSYDGQGGGQELRGNGDPIILRGCYDKKLHKAVKAILRRRCMRGRPQTAGLHAAVRELRKLVHLPKVGYVPIT